MERRDFIRAGSMAAVVGLAGCSGNSSGGGSGNSSGGGSGNSSGGGSGNSSGGGSGKSKTFKIFVPRPKTHFTARGIDRLGNELSKATNGRLKAQYVNIGSEEDGINAVSSGSIDGSITSMTALTQTFDQKYGFLEGPFVTQSWDHFKNMAEKYLYGDNGFNSELAAQGNLRVHGSTIGGWRGITANKPTPKPGDVKGLTMRLPQFDTWVKTWESIGVSAKPIPTDQIYQALKTGVVAASEGPITQAQAYSLQEVQDYFMQLKYLLLTFNWVINEDSWSALSESDQKLFDKKLNQVTKWQVDEQKKQKIKAKKQLQNQMKFIPPGEMDREGYYKATQPAVQSIFENTWGPSRKEVLSLAPSTSSPSTSSSKMSSASWS